MKKITAFAFAAAVLLTAALCLSGCGSKKLNTLEKITKQGMITAGVREDARPFGYIDETGNYAGFDIDIAKFAAKKLTGSENNVKFVSLTAAERIEAAASGRVDIVIAAMSNTPARQNFIDFSAPYYTAGQTAAVKKESRIYSFADLKNKTIAAPAGTTAKQNLQRTAAGAVIKEYKNYIEAFNALKNGGADAVCADDGIIAGFISQNSGYRVLNSRISSEYYSIGIQKTEDKALKNKLDLIIEEMNRTGLLLSLKKKWDLN